MKISRILFEHHTQDVLCGTCLISRKRYLWKICRQTRRVRFAPEKGVVGGSEKYASAFSQRLPELETDLLNDLIEQNTHMGYVRGPLWTVAD